MKSPWEYSGGDARPGRRYNQPPMPAPASPLVLAYAVDSPRHPRSRLDLPFLLLGLPALAAVIAPFTYGVSPAEVMLRAPREFDWTSWDPSMAILLVAVPFLTPVFACVLRFRSMLWGWTTRAERAVGYAAASVGAAAVAGLLAAAAVQWATVEWKERAYYGAALLVLAAGATLMAVLWRRNAHPEVRVRAALLTPYLANCAVVLIAFVDDPEVGWYLTAVSAAAALAELVLVAVRNPARPAL